MPKRDITWPTTQEYEGKLQTDAGVQLDTDEDLIRFSETSSVVSIHSIKLHPAPKLVSQHVLSGPDDPNVPTSTQSAHALCGVDTLHEECKFRSGGQYASLVRATTLLVTTIREPRLGPLIMDCGGHGTHVTGILGANRGYIYDISGRCRLLSYRQEGDIMTIGAGSKGDASPLSSTESLPIYAISKTMVADYTCAPPPEDFPDLSLYTVLILRGNLRFLHSGTHCRVPLFGTEDGVYLSNRFLAVSPPTSPSSELLNRTGDLVSILSTYVPTSDPYMKYSVATPGGSIVLTCPRSQGSLAIESRASMAAPYGSFVFPGQLLLNDTANFTGKHTIKITNGSNKYQAYKINRKLAGERVPALLTAGGTTAGMSHSIPVIYSKYIEISSQDREVLSVIYIWERRPGLVALPSIQETWVLVSSLRKNQIPAQRTSQRERQSLLTIPIVGGLATYEHNPRHSDSTGPDVGYRTFIVANNTFANKTLILNRRCKILLGGLKITGDLMNEADYEA
ncbi:hypothetical protein CPB86DRAFT_837502 [Serendipita vermifera]|nr:hypothetical protein CPB86DRAFT_837502 [Serendipita vermifera]